MCIAGKVDYVHINVTIINISCNIKVICVIWQVSQFLLFNILVNCIIGLYIPSCNASYWILTMKCSVLIALMMAMCCVCRLYIHSYSKARVRIFGTSQGVYIIICFFANRVKITKYHLRISNIYISSQGFRFKFWIWGRG